MAQLLLILQLDCFSDSQSDSDDSTVQVFGEYRCPTGPVSVVDLTCDSGDDQPSNFPIHENNPANDSLAVNDSPSGIV